MGEISERLQEYNQKVQEQAFLLGYRNGFREGELAQSVLHWVREQAADPDISQERLDVLRDVEHFLASNGAFIQEDQEITHPPGLLFYVGAFEAQPFVQVAGERIHIEDLDFQWDPDTEGRSAHHEPFEPQGGTGGIELEFTMELEQGSEEREALMQFLEGLR